MARATTPRDGDDTALDADPPAPDPIPEAGGVDTPAAAPSASPPPPPSAPRGPGAPTLLLGGVAAAALGFALSLAVPGGWPVGGTAALETRLAAQEAEAARLAALLAERPAPPDLSPLADGLGALRRQVESLQAAVAALPPAADVPDPSPRLEALDQGLAEVSARIDALAALPAGVAGGDPEAAAQLARDLAAVRAQLAAQQDSAATATAGIAAAVEEAKAALAAARAEAQALQAEATAAVATARRDGALGRIAAAVDSGAPFEVALADLAATGAEPPEALTALAIGGAPTLLSLQAAFPDVARAALEASLRADMGETTMDRIGSFLRTQTGARSLTPREGNDPDAVLSRAEARLAAGDLAGTLAELGNLPGPGQAAVADWAARAQARLDAAQAVATLMAAP